jgi:hypothetical protein
MNQEGSLPTHTPRPSAQTHAPNMAFSRQNRGLTFKAVPDQSAERSESLTLFSCVHGLALVYPQIGLYQSIIIQQRLTCAFHHRAAAFQDVSTV